MPGPTLEVGKLSIATEVDYSGVQGARQHLERETAQQGRAGGESLKKGILAGLAGTGALVASTLTRTLKGPLALLGRGISSVFDLGAVSALALTRSIRVLSQRVAESNSQWAGMAKVMNGAATVMEKVAGVALRVSAALTGMKIAAGAAAAAVLIAANRAATDFVPEWNRVRTLLGDAPDDFAGLRYELTRVSAQAGVEAPEAMRAYYEILSAMPALVREPARALDILAVSLDVASTGFGTARESAKALTAILNAFNLEASDARRVSDALFATQDQGVTTFGEIAESIGTVGDLTASLGGRFEDLLGIIATTTDTGVTTAERMTQLRSVISAIVKPTREAGLALEDYDIALGAAALEADGLVGFLVRLIQVTGGNPDVLAQVFPQESLGLVLSLARQTGVLIQKTKAIGDAAGTTSDKVDTMNDSWERQWELLTSRLDPALIGIGVRFQGLGATGLKVINELFRAWDRLVNFVESDPLALSGARGRAALFGGDPTGTLLDPTLGRRPRELQPFEQGFVEMLQRGLQPELVRTTGPLVRPAEPTSIEFSQEKIEALSDALRTQAFLQLALTGDVEAYEAAIRDAQDQVNALVLAEAQRLEQAGVEASEIAKLISAYQGLGDVTDQVSKKREQAAAQLEGLEEQLADRLRQLTATATDDLLAAIDKMEEEAREAAETAGVELSEGFLDGLEELRNDARLTGVLEGLQDRFRDIGELDVGKGQQRALEQLIEDLTERTAALEDGSTAQRAFNDLLREAERLHRRNAKAIAEDTKRTKEQTQAEKERRAQEAERQRQDELRDLRDRARLIEENARAALQLAEAFGAVDDQTARVLEGLVQVGAAVSRIAGGDFTAIPSAIGGFAQVVSGLFGDSGAERRHAELIRSQAELINALRSLEGAFLSDITAGDREAILAVAERLEPIARGDKSGRQPIIELNADELAKLIRLEELTGIQFLDGNKIQGFDDFERFLAAVEAFRNRGLASFGEDLGGRLDALGFLFSTLGDRAGDAASQLEQFLDVLEQFPEAAGLARELRRLAAEDPAAAQGLIDDVARAFASGGLEGVFAAFPGLFDPETITAEELERIITDANRFLVSVIGGGDGGTTQAFQVSRTITETSAGVMIGTLSTIAALEEQQRDLQREMLLQLQAFSGQPFAAPSLAAVGLAGSGGGGTPGSAFEINFHGPLSEVTVNGGDPGAIEEIRVGAEVGARRAADQIDRQLQSLYQNHLRSQGR